MVHGCVGRILDIALILLPCPSLELCIYQHAAAVVNGDEGQLAIRLSFNPEQRPDKVDVADRVVEVEVDVLAWTRQSRVSLIAVVL